MKTRIVILALACVVSACGQTKSSAKTECDAKSFIAVSINGYPYKCVNGRLIPDQEARNRQMEWVAKEEKERSALVFAGLSRLLTASEMKEVERRGPDLFLPTCAGICEYDRPALERQFNALLLQQFKFRLAIGPSR